MIFLIKPWKGILVCRECEVWRIRVETISSGNELVICGTSASTFTFLAWTTVGGTIGGAAAVSAFPAVMVGGVAFVWVGVGLKLGLSLASGDSPEEAVEHLLGNPGPIHGPNIGVLFAGDNGSDNDDLTPPVQDGIDGREGIQGVAEGPGIYGDVTISRTIVAENEARGRSFTRTETVIEECLDPTDFQNGIKTVIDCTNDPFGVHITQETTVFELTQHTTEFNRDEVAGGSIASDGSNLVGVASTGFTNNDLTGTAAHPFDAGLFPSLAFNGGPTPTIKLRSDSPANDAVSLASPNTDISQNSYIWISQADIGAWGGATNAAPTAAADAFTILEGENLVVADRHSLADNDSDPNGDPLSVVLSSNLSPGVGTLVPDSNGNGFEYQITDPDFFGQASFSYYVTDGEFNSNLAMVTINVLPVNDAPQVVPTELSVQFVNNGNPITVPNFVSMDPGPANESDQEAIGYTTTLSGASDPSLFTSPPTISPDGTLSFTPATGKFGGASILVTVQDDGGTANGGVDTSSLQVIDLTLTAPAPGPSIADVIVAGSEWDPTFIDAVDGGGIASGNGLGYSLVGSHQAETLPWNDLDTLYLVFSEDVSASLADGDVTLSGTNGGAYTLGNLSYGVAGPNIATIPLEDLAASGIGTDRLVLSIADGAVQDAGGNSLNGEWTAGQSVPSGDATTGGQFNFFFNVLPGDADGSEQVNSTDALTIFASNASATTAGLSRLDINGSGQITSTDATAAFANNAAGLPAAPQAPSSLTAAQLFTEQQVSGKDLVSLAYFADKLRFNSLSAKSSETLDTRAQAFAELAPAADSTISLIAIEQTRSAERNQDRQVVDGAFSDFGNGAFSHFGNEANEIASSEFAPTSLSPQVPAGFWREGSPA